jgi:hypothetical protein
MNLELQFGGTEILLSKVTYIFRWWIVSPFASLVFVLAEVSTSYTEVTQAYEFVIFTG